jgi:uncharacterized protein DUF1583
VISDLASVRIIYRKRPRTGEGWLQMSVRDVFRMSLIIVFGLVATSLAQADEFVQKFQGNGWDSRIFRLTGPGASSLIHPETEGLRITIPPEHGMKPAVGLALHNALKGNFEVKMDFEILQVDKPTGGNGAGVSIWLTMVSRTNDAATIWRMTSKNGDSYFGSHRATTPEGGKRKHTGGLPIATTTKSGTLSFERIGSTLYYRVESNGQIDEIYETELGLDDVNMIRFGADNGGSPTLVDARIKGITIRTDKLGSATPLPPRTRWFTWLNIGISLVLVIVAIAGGYWFWRRRTN